MKVYCYECKKEVQPRCSRCGHNRTKDNAPLGLCEVCSGTLICPSCGKRRFSTQ